ncbi:MAG: ABC transporter substrate-binding protein [Candidatus Promineifilaceae bacterium]|nr:ABC transporter substrate-binding protein [Candidatus Promineifilaceae bacterium]
MARNLKLWLVVVLALGLLLTACGTEVEPETIVEQVEVEVTRLVEVAGDTVVEEVVVTATPDPEAMAEEEAAAEEPAVESDTILIGGFGPLSAPGSYQGGTEMRQAAELAVDEVNEAGGVLGKQVELIFGDTEGLPERGTAVTERLITQNNVVGLVGEYHSGVALAEMEVAHKYGVPVVFAEPWSDDVTGSGYAEIFRIAPSIDFYSSIATNYIADVGWESVVFVAEDSDYGREQSETWRVQLEELGITDVEVIFADPATEDFTPILQRIAQDPPDMLGGIVTGIGNSRMVNQACELGLAPTAQTAYYASIDAQYPEFWENVGECGQYVFFTYVGLPKTLWNEKTEAFMTNFEERYGTVPGGAALESYDATHMMLAAIEDAGSTAPEEIIAALEDMEYTGALGEIWFEYGSDNPVPEDEPAWMWHQWPTPTVMILQYTEVGQSVDEAAVVYPPERATIDDLYVSPPE